MAEKGSQCPSCGTAEWEYDPAQGGDPNAYEAVPIRCAGCAAKDVAREVAGKELGPGVTITLVPRAVAERMQQTRARRPKSKRERAAGNRRGR